MTKVEQVAQAIWLSRNGCRDKPVPASVIKEWNEAPYIRSMCMNDARAAIAAMREPTDEQRRIASRIIGPYGGHGEPRHPVEATVWHSMIDAALKETE